MVNSMSMTKKIKVFALLSTSVAGRMIYLTGKENIIFSQEIFSTLENSKMESSMGKVELTFIKKGFITLFEVPSLT